MSTETETIITIITNSITALAAIVVAGVAIYGVFWEWKKQMRGKTDYEIARRYLKTVLQLRDAIKFVRNPFISIDEMQVALEENGFDSKEYEDKNKTNRAVYSLRWKKVTDTWTTLEAELIEAEVSWGKEAVEVQKSLDDLVRKLRGALWLYLNGDVKGGFSENKLIYDVGEDDKFSKKVLKAIEKIETYLKQHLK